MKRRGFLAFLLSAPVTRSLPWKAISRVIAPVAPAASLAIDRTFSEMVAAVIRARTPELLASIRQRNALLEHLQGPRA
jgi:hypothetical protein